MSASTSPRDTSFYRDSAPAFAALMALALVGFWPTYLQPPFERDWHAHVHGIALFLWGALLVVQPWLIARAKWPLHRALGRVSYGLAPIVVVSTLLLAHYRLQTNQTPNQVYFLWVQLALIALYAYAYAQAIRHRRRAALHARYIVGTALTMVDPILARIIDVHAGIGPPSLQVITYAIVDGILVVLWLRDRRLGNGISVFPRMLLWFALAEAPTFFLPGTPAWIGFANLYASLPLP